MPKPSRISVVTERGQVSIPAELRKELALEKGSRLLWERAADSELRAVVLPAREPRGSLQMLGFARRFRSTRPTAEWMAELRQGESPERNR
ncbi:MAG TPA: AbrB/MazE/SpoVT family DNA-binding domain-containing protein [Thermoanaerobaculia bacterium]|jgi:AbrB family looped-hinge helix DNA binding protein|nr:AbrB/MazE/SpoVT family DNA-binding domain-containing protein [Thermoanaerobaculia bacterium]